MGKVPHRNHERAEQRISAATSLLMCALTVLAQIAVTLLLVHFLKEKASFVYGILQFIGAVVAIRVYLRTGSPSYKLSWMCLLLILPVSGMILFCLWGGTHQAKQLSLRPVPPIPQRESVRMLSDMNQAALTRRSPTWGRLSAYLQKRDFWLYRSTNAAYFPEGEPFFQDLIRQLKQAETYIFMEYYILAEGSVWDEIFAVLRERAAAGVEIHLIIDDFGTLTRLSDEMLQSIKDAGIEVEIFNPVHKYISRLYFNYRDHRKITVIDGYVAYTGGINIGDEYANRMERFGHWKDTGLMFKGPGVENLTIMFLEMWNAFEEKEGGYRDFVPAEYEEKGGEGDGYILSFSDSPLDDENASENVYADILYNANDYVYITTPYLAIDSSLQNALCLAAKRGVDVRLITPGIPDKKMVYRLTRSYYASLIRAGVKIYEYTPGFVHAKSYVADDKIGVVGTINMDYRSLYLHFECGTLMYDSPAVIDLRNDDLATIEKCRKIELSDCRTSFFGELIDRVLRVIAPLL